VNDIYAYLQQASVIRQIKKVLEKQWSFEKSWWNNGAVARSNKIIWKCKSRKNTKDTDVDYKVGKDNIIDWLNGQCESSDYENCKDYH